MAATDTRVVEPHAPAPPERGVAVRAAATAICFAVPIVILLSPLPIEADTKLAFAISAFMIASWMTQAMDYAAAGLIGCFFFWVTGVAEPDTVFDGFTNINTWFVFAAMLLGLVAARSSLPGRIGRFIVTNVGLSYSRILLGLIVTDFALTFVIPTGTGRVVVMATIAVGLIKLFGVPGQSNIARGMFLIITYTATIFDKMILAGAASVVARGAIVENGGVELGWGLWFISFLPCDIITILFAWRLTLWLYPPEVTHLEAGQRHELQAQFDAEKAWTPTALKGSILILGAIAVWMTDTIHGTEPALVAFAVAVLALLPFTGVLSTADLKKTDLLPFLFVGTAFGMTEVLRETGGLQLLADSLGGLEPLLSNPWVAVPVLYWGAFFYHLFLASELTMLATSVPILMEIATDHGLNPLWVGLVWTFAAGGKLFVYQSAVLVVGYSYGYFRHTDLIRMGLALTIVEFFGVLFTTTFWWPIIGITP
jgi:anion transporter